VALVQDSDSNIVERTLRVFQPRTTRGLTEEDAREIDRNLVGFFSVLLEWEAAARTPKQQFAQSPSHGGEWES
jgi:hypothetical protein